MPNIILKTVAMTFIVVLALIALVTGLPINKLLASQTNQLSGLSISVIDKISLLNGNVYLQADNQTDVWLLDYKLCSFTVWCIELSSDTNKLEARLKLRPAGISFEDLEFVGNSRVFKALIPNQLAEFDITAQAEEIVIKDLACPSRNLVVNNASGKMSDLNFLGQPFADVEINIKTNRQASANSNSETQSSLVALLTGAFDGSVTLESSVYQGEVIMPNMTSKLADLIATNSSGNGWKINGNLSCGWRV